MKLEDFKGKGSRGKFWNEVYKEAQSLQKIEGDNVSIDYHSDGCVIHVGDRGGINTGGGQQPGGSGPPGGGGGGGGPCPGGGGCCCHKSGINDPCVTHAACDASGGGYQGDGTDCSGCVAGRPYSPYCPDPCGGIAQVRPCFADCTGTQFLQVDCCCGCLLRSPPPSCICHI